MSRFELAIFDLDGVLADSARLHFLAWKTIADDLGIPFDEGANEALKGVDRIGSLRAILAIGNRTLPDSEIAALAERKNAAFVAAVADMTPDDLLPGVPALLDAVATRGLRAAVASASRNAPAVLERLGIADGFDYVADPALCRPKPAPDLFLACATAIGIMPLRCVAFEDAAAGVAAIKAAEMRAVGIGDPHLLAAADFVFPATAAIDLAAVLDGA